MRARLCLLFLTTLVVVLAIRCADADTTCTSEGRAEVCATPKGGQVLISASGLEPGSELRLETLELESQAWTVGPSGEPTGQIVFVRRDANRAMEISVQATDATGETVGGTLNV